MKIQILKLCLVFGFWLVALSSSYAYGEVTSLREILSQPDSFDGVYVEVEGEAIGEPLRSNEKAAWLNIASGSYNLGIFSSDAETLKKISYWGGYKEEGDWLRAGGVFYKHCPLHQISDMHLEDLEIIEIGIKNEDVVALYKVRLAAVFFTICFITGLVYFIKRKRSKRE